MKWFAVNCIYQVICGDGKHSPQFNEQTRLIYAQNACEALNKAKMMASGFNAPFKSCEGKPVIWTFISIGGIIEIDEPADGVEVSSKILEPKSVKKYLKKLTHRNKILTETNQ